jgi:hypothetical protein
MLSYMASVVTPICANFPSWGRGDGEWNRFNRIDIEVCVIYTTIHPGGAVNEFFRSNKDRSGDRAEIGL